MNLNYIYFFILILVIQLILTKLTITQSHKLNLFIDDETTDKPQGFHEKPTPRIGGLSIFLSVVITLIFDFSMWPLILAFVPAFASGVLEDFSSKISPKVRLVYMSFSAIIAILLMETIITNFGFFSVPTALGVIITFIAIIGMTNGLNMVDGYNGLAGITTLIILFNFLILTSEFHDSEYFLFIGCMIAAIIGFLFFNYPGGNIFLGDGGAYFIGAALAIISINLYNRHSSEVSPWFFLVTLIYPVWEVIFSFFRKIFIHKTSPFMPDPHHFHMLVFRNIVNKKNSLVVLFVAPLLVTINVLAYYFRTSDLALMLISFLFIVTYCFTYIRLRMIDKENNLLEKSKLTSKSIN